MKHNVGRPCDADGNYLPPGSPPAPYVDPVEDLWEPFQDRTEFELADFLYRRNQMPADDIDMLLDIWASKDLKHDDCPPFADHDDMYETIDAIPHGDVAWECFSTSYQGDKPEDAPAWMNADYEVWFRDPRTVVNNMLGNQDFRHQFDYSPFREYDGADTRQFENFMSGDWAWQQAVCCATIPEQTLTSI